MENLSLFPSKYLLLGSLPNPSGLSSRRFFALPQPSGKIREGTPKTRNFVSALGQSSYDGSARRLPKKGGNILKGECDYFFNLVARYARVLTKLVLHLKKSFQKLWPTLKLLWRFKIQECKLPSWIVHRIL
ncbi:uncharacterized protein LOC122083534 isoform X4 [Macadamia integrifolia]|uniref:uncharacterized protein LOC122083534 isoform X4 n=1 Tax=Macadamia integrifolia TaxID=60698 RepID=UPI001C4F3CD3|nr:uncharacterized protein LOC122083534 isoform X4 [Macadamia integrifolia]